MDAVAIKELILRRGWSDKCLNESPILVANPHRSTIVDDLNRQRVEKLVPEDDDVIANAGCPTLLAIGWREGRRSNTSISAADVLTQPLAQFLA